MTAFIEVRGERTFTTPRAYEVGRLKALITKVNWIYTRKLENGAESFLLQGHYGPTKRVILAGKAPAWVALTEEIKAECVAEADGWLK